MTNKYDEKVWQFYLVLEIFVHGDTKNILLAYTSIGNN